MNIFKITQAFADLGNRRPSANAQVGDCPIGQVGSLVAAPSQPTAGLHVPHGAEPMEVRDEVSLPPGLNETLPACWSVDTSPQAGPLHPLLPGHHRGQGVPR